MSTRSRCVTQKAEDSADRCLLGGPWSGAVGVRAHVRAQHDELSVRDQSTHRALTLRNRFIVVGVFLALAGWGWWAIRVTPIDAIPDLLDNQVIVRESNLNVGGNVLESNGAWLIVQGVGLIASVDDIKNIVIAASNGVPVYVAQVADVKIGDAFRVESLVKGELVRR